MPTSVVLGAQWGDEGKGKIIDMLTEEADMVVRFGGGANAGHTLVINGQKTVLHLLPSGIMRPGSTNLIGPMVACDLEVLADELAVAAASGATVWLDRHAPIVLPAHKLLDGAREAGAGGQAIGTTKRGIGPVFGDYWARFCLRLGDLIDKDRISRILKRYGFYAEKEALAKHYGVEVPGLDETVEWANGFTETVRPYLADTRRLVAEAMRQNRRLLFEGAQGILLDLVQGTAPYQTSSLCGIAGIGASYGLYRFNRVIGVTKAYCTRVGGGPFPTEINGPLGERLRQQGAEYGATTGRPRRCGWLDLPALRFACRMAGITELAMTKIDVLAGLPTVRAAVNYLVDGQDLAIYQSLTTELMEAAVPDYRNLPPVPAAVSKARRFRDLPYAAERLVGLTEMITDRPVLTLGVGADREAVLTKRPRAAPSAF